MYKAVLFDLLGTLIEPPPMPVYRQMVTDVASALANDAGHSLNEIQSAVQIVTNQVEPISAAAEQVTASSDEMVKSIKSVSAITEETTAATEQMPASNDQVQEAMGSISAITAETGASVEESSAATDELSSQVEEVVASASALGDMARVLTSAVGRFKLSADDNSEQRTTGCVITALGRYIWKRHRDYSRGLFL